MKISEIAEIMRLKYTKDAKFYSLGYCDQRTEKLFTFCENIQYTKKLQDNVSAIITDYATANNVNFPAIISDNPKEDFFKIHRYLFTETNFYQHENISKISNSAEIADTAIISPIGVNIGDGCVIEAHVVIGENVTIGNHCIIRSGSIVGGEGFEFKKIDDQLERVPHAGRVLIGDHVEIQHNVIIDRAVFNSSTKIGAHSKLDNLVHIAHNVVIGERTLVAAGAIIAGSAIIGNGVWIGPGVIVSNGLTIGDNAFLAIGSTVIRSIPKDARAYGKNLSCVIKLPDS